MSKNPEIPRQKKGLLSSVLSQKTLQQNIDEGTYNINEEKKAIDKLL
jgi:hypothetical protein